ncbi:MAG: glycosyltransferase family 2 protein [Planctomycetaceae bacterium]
MPFDTILSVSSVLLTLALFATAIVQLRWHRRFVTPFQTGNTSEDGEHTLPPAAVVLCLRGADPFLEDCLRGLFEQDHPDYHVRIVVDNIDDPAHAVVRAVRAEYPRVDVVIDILRNPVANRSLKVHALLQAVTDLDPRFESVTVLDADAVPYRSWLRDLVRPLRDPQVGVTTGIRWFVPEQRTIPNLVRRQWNIWAVVHMHAMQVPWGGSMAISRHLLDGTGRLDVWAHSFSDDTPLSNLLQRTGLELRVVPSAAMPNRESISFGSLLRFVRRQLLFIRLDSTRWSTALALTIWSVIPFTLASAVAGVACWQGHWSAWLLVPVLLMYNSIFIIGSKMTSRCVRRSLRQRGVELSKSRFDMRTCVVAQLSLAISLFAAVSAACARRFDWRGVTYVRGASRRFELLRYVPYRPTRHSAGARDVSI